RVLGVAAVLVDDPRLHRVGAVVGEGAALGGRDPGAGVGGGREVAVRAAVGVVEAGRGVGARRIRGAGEGDGRGRALVLRAVVRERRGRVGVCHLDIGRVLRVAAV